MKPLVLFLACLFLCSQSLRADHITGGSMSYTFTNFADGKYNYRLTLKLYMRCNSGRQFNDPTIFGVFDRITNERIASISDFPVALTRTETINMNTFSPCITNPPAVCYEIGYFETTISLPPSENGYLLSAQVVYRIQGINNFVSNYNNIGATYTAEIPGTSLLPDAPENNSANFTANDLVAVCSNNSFSYSFGAEDKDGDKLNFSLCNAYQGGFGGFGNNSNPPQSPPYSSVPYDMNYGGSSPLGSHVKIDPSNGLITGIAPSDGIYVVTVCVEEIRNGKVIAVQRKDIQINISGCSIASASIPADYMLCKDTRSITVSNFSSSPLIKSYNWDFIDVNGNVLYSSDSRSASYTFPREGDYSIKLVVNRGGECADSSQSAVKVYPGFMPDFRVEGLCFNKPTRFLDASTTVFGRVDGWKWSFDGSGATSPLQNPSYTYFNPGNKQARLIATNSVGCRDTITKTVAIIDKPPIQLAFRDTLICAPEDLQLRASGQGNMVWSPTLNMRDAHTATPTVGPFSTTTYYIDLDQDGCLNRDSVIVNVVDHVTLEMMKDTTICAGDTIRLRTVTDGLRFTWTPGEQLIRSDVASPYVVTPVSTRYSTIASIGRCTASGSVLVTAVPYPVANAGADTMICYDTPAQLHGTMDGSSFKWIPDIGGGNGHGNLLNATVKPRNSTLYTLVAYDTRGCPKPGFDSVWVNVLPPIQPYAGRDTSVVVGQPLQLQASGGSAYYWSPAEGMSDYQVANPRVMHSAAHPGIRYRALIANEAGCLDSAFITVKVYHTRPSVFVPNAFTPNGDGRNDQFSFVTAGIQKVEYFHVYNRFGQLVFNAYNEMQKWDGSIGGTRQPSGSYVWVVKAVDYNGSTYFDRGTVTLIR